MSDDFDTAPMRRRHQKRKERMYDALFGPGAYAAETVLRQLSQALRDVDNKPSRHILYGADQKPIRNLSDAEYASIKRSIPRRS